MFPKTFSKNMFFVFGGDPGTIILVRDHCTCVGFGEPEPDQGDMAPVTDGVLGKVIKYFTDKGISKDFNTGKRDLNGDPFGISVVKWMSGSLLRYPAIGVHLPRCFHSNG